MPLSAVLSPQVPAAIRGRGQDYFRSGAVAFDSVTGREVRATVQGGEDYEVDLDLEGRSVFAYCTCPYVEEHGHVCKHIWATILAAESRGFAATAAATGRLQLIVDEDNDYDDYDDEYDDEYDDYRPAPPYPRAAFPPPPARRNDWKNQLATLSHEVQPLRPDFRQPTSSARSSTPRSCLTNTSTAGRATGRRAWSGSRRTRTASCSW